MRREMGRRGVNQHEPVSMEELEQMPESNACRSMFRNTVWPAFFAKFQGYDDTVSLKFALGFDGKIARIRDVVMRVSEKTISHATGLPIHGERWFKN